MGDKSRIEWTDATWTPIRARRLDTGKVGVHCELVSEGCKNCYAASHNKRNLPVHGTGLDFTILNREKVEIFVDEEMLMAPLRWKRPRRIFVCSQTDLFGEFVKYEQIDQVFSVMALAPQHTFQVLTKRPEIMFQYLTGVRSDLATAKPEIEMRWQRPARFFPRGFKYLPLNQQGRMPWPLPNVWLGVTAENQARADERIPVLLQTPAARRFVSVEPMLGPVFIDRYLRPHWTPRDVADHGPWLDWVICGGESGRGARPVHPDWARGLRDQCVSAAVPFHFKQWGEWEVASHENGHYSSDMARNGAMWVAVDGTISGPSSNGLENPYAMIRVGKKAAGRLLDGVEWNQFPEAPGGRQ